jgi:hypothetical protein
MAHRRLHDDEAALLLGPEHEAALLLGLEHGAEAALLLGLEHGASPVTRRSAKDLFAPESSAFRSRVMCYIRTGTTGRERIRTGTTGRERIRTGTTGRERIRTGTTGRERIRTGTAGRERGLVSATAPAYIYQFANSDLRRLGSDDSDVTTRI